MRAIIFLLLVVLVFFIVRFTLNRIIEIRDKQNLAEQKRQAMQDNEEQPNQASQEMVRCAYCGVHVPQSEAYFDGKDTFCSEGHMSRFHAEKQSED